MNSFTASADSGSSQTISDGNTLNIAGGTGIDTAASATDTVTVTLNTEAVQDIVGAMFTGNTETRISATYEDSDGTIDLAVDDMTADTQLTTEQVQDIVGAMFTGNTETNITVTYEDSDGTIDLVATGNTTEQIQDIVGAMFTGNTETGITVTYEDSDGTIDLVVAAQDSTAIVDGDSDTKIQVDEGGADEDKFYISTDDLGGWVRLLFNYQTNYESPNDTGEDNADAHMKRQVMGREVVVAITNGELDFGPWETIFYGEFDGRRNKRVLVKIIGE